MAAAWAKRFELPVTNVSKVYFGFSDERSPVAVIDRGGRLVLEEASLIGVFFLAAVAVTGGRLFFGRLLLGWLRFRLCFGHDLEAHLVLAAQYGADRVLDDREVVAGDPVLDEVVLDAQDKSVVGQGERLDRLEPLEG